VRSIRERAFYFIQKPFDREVLLTLVQRCFELRRLSAENRRYTQRVAQELEDARRFQRRLLPAPVAACRGIAIAGRYESCFELGGDFFDYCDIGDGRVAVMVADVSGHGVSAAMLTAVVKSAFHDAADDAHAPDAVVQRIAQATRTCGPDRFVTVFCARLDPADGSLEYVNAGHPPGLLLAADGEPIELCDTGAVISPVLTDADWEVRRVAMPPGARLFVYTDGITEAPGDGEEMFGETRLHASLRELDLDGAGLLEGVLERVRAFTGGRPADDDMTMLTATYGSASP
jgi:sigma-B regulation protein RsbU (phosphoserine phosphatase)